MDRVEQLRQQLESYVGILTGGQIYRSAEIKKLSDLIEALIDEKIREFEKRVARVLGNG